LFNIAETELFSAKIKKEPYRAVSSKLKDYVYPQLRENPFFGPNIKKLKGEFESVYRYRIGKFRVFYVINEQQIVVILVDLEQRKDSYR